MPVCSSGSARKRAEAVAVVVVEIALDEDDVGDADGAGEAQVVGGRGGAIAAARGSAAIVVMVSRDPAGTAPTL